MTGPMIGTIGEGLYARPDGAVASVGAEEIRVVAPPVERRGPAAFVAAS